MGPERFSVPSPAVLNDPTPPEFDYSTRHPLRVGAVFRLAHTHNPAALAELGMRLHRLGFLGRPGFLSVARYGPNRPEESAMRWLALSRADRDLYADKDADYRPAIWIADSLAELVRKADRAGEIALIKDEQEALNDTLELMDGGILRAKRVKFRTDQAPAQPPAGPGEGVELDAAQPAATDPAIPEATPDERSDSPTSIEGAAALAQPLADLEEPETEKPTPVERITIRKHSRGPVAGEANQVTRDREALYPAIRNARKKGEPWIRVVTRLDEAKKITPPGGGSPEYRRKALARVCGKMERQLHTNSGQTSNKP